MQIGENIIDKDGYCCRVTGLTANSIELFQLRRTKNGINCKQWYHLDREFNERFRWGLNGYLDFINKSSYEQIKTYFRTKSMIDSGNIWQTK